MLNGYSVEQVFIKPKAGQLEVALVLVAVSGAIKHETLLVPTLDAQQAVKMVAKTLAMRPDIDGFECARLRVARQGRLEDDCSLLARLKRSYLEAREH